MLFFLLPFGLLAALVAAGPVGRWELRLALIVQVVLAVVFALVAFYQYAAKDVFWNPKIIVGNEYASFFRVNSLFWDASIYGRFMAMTIVLAGRRRRLPAADAAAGRADRRAVRRPVPHLLAVEPAGAGGGLAGAARPPSGRGG